MTKRHRLWLALACAAALIAGLGYWAGSATSAAYYKTLFASIAPLQQASTEYPLVAPLLGFRAPEAVDLGDYQALKSAMQNDITDAGAGGAVARASVYFRDLNTARWIGINQSADYYPASLLKVPVMIAFYKEAESDPSVLDQWITYQTIALSDPFDAPSTLVPGKAYSVEQLIEAMIINSDNGATLTLLNHVDQNVLSDVYANLGIESPGDNSSAYQISTRTYGLFFRVLYNATYLDAEYSNKALALLSRATFASGLVAGLPSGTQVAHKFGEHILNQGTQATGVELHDCGVVYYPAHPYLLCVMTSTKNLPTAAALIKSISATTYAAVAAEYAQ
jgi:beta-lactamase class A